MNELDDGGTSSRRRFRKRGGVKKKKKETAGAQSAESERLQVLHRELKSNIPTVHPVLPEHASHSQPSDKIQSQLGTELFNYLAQIRTDLDVLRASDSGYVDTVQDLDEPSPLLLLARNALNSLKPNIHEVSMDPTGSHVLESLFRAARSDPHILNDSLSAILSLGARRVCALIVHRCGSHVLQCLSQAILEDMRLEALAGRSPSTPAVLIQMIAQDWTIEELVDVICNPCGTHVFRVIVAGLAGLPTEEPKEHKLDDSSEAKRIRSYVDRFGVDVPSEWLDGVVAIARRLLEQDPGDGLHQMLWSAASCAALQGLLSGVTRHDREVAKALAAAAIKDSLVELCYSSTGARFVERCIICLGPAAFMPKLKGQLALMAADANANFVVQRVLLMSRGRGAVMSLWDELEPTLTTLVGHGSAREGVILAMVRSAEVEGDEQVRRRASRAIAKSFNAVGPNAKHLCGLLAMGNISRWSTWRSGVQSWFDTNLPRVQIIEKDLSSALHHEVSLPRTSMLGVLMARCLLRYPGGPGQVARDSMANLTVAELLGLVVDSSGSRLVEQWIDSDEEHGTGKASSTVLTAILDTGQDEMLLSPITFNPYGAQVVIRVVGRVQGPLKKRAMHALAARADLLKEHPSGQQIIRKCRVLEFIRRQDQWTAVETAKETRARIFADILAQPLSQQRENGPQQIQQSSDASVEYAGVRAGSVKSKKKAKYSNNFKQSARQGQPMSVHENLSADCAVPSMDDPSCSQGVQTVLSAIQRVANENDESRRKKQKKEKRQKVQ